MSGLINTIGTAVQNINQREELTLNDIKDRQEASRLAGITKIAALAAIIVSVAMAIFSLLTMGFMGMMLLGGLSTIAAIVAKDIYTIASRVQKTVDNAATDIPNTPIVHKYNQARYLTEGTWLIQAVLLLFINRTSSADSNFTPQFAHREVTIV